MAEETKHDLMLKRTQVIIAILTATVGLVLGVYNMNKSMFTKNYPGDILATVRGDAGRPLGNARVELYNSGNTLLAASETHSDGVYSKKDVDAGSYVLKVSRDGYEPQVSSIQVASKKTAEFDVVLRALPSAQAASPLRSALEETGASWIRTLGKPKTQEPAVEKK